MALRSFTRSGRSLAPVEEVWPLVAEVARWKDWSFVDRSELDVEGAPVPDAVGAVRSLTRYGVGSKEEVVAWDPPSHLGYRILKGFPVRDYRADVVLTEAGRAAGANRAAAPWSPGRCGSSPAIRVPVRSSTGHCSGSSSSS